MTSTQTLFYFQWSACTAFSLVIREKEKYNFKLSWITLFAQENFYICAKSYLVGTH